MKSKFAPAALLAALASVGLSTASTNAQAADLLEVYQLAQQSDASYQAARYQLDAAREILPQARAALLPQVSASANAAINDTNNDGRGMYDSRTLSLSLVQPLYNQASFAGYSQAKLTLAQAEATFATAEQDLLLRVADRYFNVLRTLDNLQFAQSEKEAIARQLDQAERRFEVGLIAITDVKEAQAQYDLAVAREIAAQNSVATAREALYVTTGERVDTLDRLSEEAPLDTPQPADVEAWVEIAEDNNLSLAAARLAVRIAEEQISVNKAGHYPTLNLIGSYNNTESDGNSGDSESGSLMLKLDVPLYSGGGTSAAVRQARANALVAGQQAELQRRSTEQTARSAYLSVQSDISSVTALKQALVSTQVAADATQAGFDVGTRTAVEVLAALRNTYSAQANYRSGRYDYLLDRLRLQQAAGTLSLEDLESINSWLVP